MIDNVVITLPGQLPDENAPVNFEEKRRPWEVGPPRKGGWLRNMYVSTNEFQTTIIGSVAKYIHGHNFVSSDLPEFFEGIRDIGSELKVDMDIGFIRSVEVSATLFMDRPVSVYILLLTEVPNAMTHRYGRQQGVSFTNGARSVTFYDKIREMDRPKARKYLWPEAKANHERILQEHAAQNVLRFEVRFKNLFHRASGKIRVADLTSANVYESLISDFVEQYERVIKTPMPFASAMPTSARIPDVLDLLAAAGLPQMGGLETVLTLLEPSFEGQSNPSQARTRVRKRLQAIARQFADEDSSSLLRELDEKVHAAANLAIRKNGAMKSRSAASPLNEDYELQAEEELKLLDAPESPSPVSVDLDSSGVSSGNTVKTNR